MANQLWIGAVQPGGLWIGAVQPPTAVATIDQPFNILSNPFKNPFIRNRGTYNFNRGIDQQVVTDTPNSFVAKYKPTITNKFMPGLLRQFDATPTAIQAETNTFFLAKMKVPIAQKAMNFAPQNVTVFSETNTFFTARMKGPVTNKPISFAPQDQTTQPETNTFVIGKFTPAKANRFIPSLLWQFDATPTAIQSETNTFFVKYTPPAIPKQSFRYTLGESYFIEPEAGVGLMIVMTPGTVTTFYSQEPAEQTLAVTAETNTFYIPRTIKSPTFHIASSLIAQDLIVQEAGIGLMIVVMPGTVTTFYSPDPAEHLDTELAETNTFYIPRTIKTSIPPNAAFLPMYENYLSSVSFVSPTRLPIGVFIADTGGRVFDAGDQERVL